MLFVKSYFQIGIKTILLKREGNVTKDLLWVWNVWEGQLITGLPVLSAEQARWHGDHGHRPSLSLEEEKTFLGSGHCLSTAPGALTLRTIAAAAVKTNSFSRLRQMFLSFALPHGQTQTSFSLAQTIHPASLQIAHPGNVAGRSGHSCSVKFTDFSLLSCAGLSSQWPLTLNVTLTRAGGSSGLGWAALVNRGWVGLGVN